MEAEDPRDGSSGNQDVLEAKCAWKLEQAYFAAEAGLHDGGCQAGVETRS